MPEQNSLTYLDMVNVRFNLTKFKIGYAQGEVDDYLDEVIYAMREQNSGEMKRLLNTADFSTVKFVEGYNIEEVDAFISKVHQVLKNHIETANSSAADEDTSPSNVDEADIVTLIHRPEMHNPSGLENYKVDHKVRQIIDLLLSPNVNVPQDIRKEIASIITEDN